MLLLDEVVGLALLALWIFCIVDVITTREGECRNLPKLVWLLIVLIVPTIGAVVWLVAGRPWPEPKARKGFYAGAQPNGYPEYERLGRATGSSEEGDAEFLRQCRERAAEQRRRYEQSKRDDQV